MNGSGDHGWLPMVALLVAAPLSWSLGDSRVRVSTARSALTSLTALVVLSTFCATVGCEMPREEHGPLPRTSPSISLKRVRKWHGSGVGRGVNTYWEEGGKLVTPHDRVAGIRNAIEAGLGEHLARKQVAKLNGGRRFERPSTYVHATVISLTPDIAIASVAETLVDSTEGPFDNFISQSVLWPGATSRPNDPKREFGNEYINCYNGNLTVSAGPLVPFNEEMYAISGDKDVPIQKIQFAGRDATIVVQNAAITMKREGAIIHVGVEYR